MIASAHAAGRSPISRCPQSAITRSGARSRRAYSNASSTGSWLSRAPQSTSAGQANAIEVEPHVVADERLRGADGVGVPRGAGEEPLDDLGRQRRWVRRAPAPEDELPQERRAHDPVAVRRDPAAGLEDPGDRQRVAGGTRRRRDPRGAGEHDRAHRLRPADRQAQRDRSAQRVARRPRRGRRLRARAAARAGRRRASARVRRGAARILRGPAARARAAGGRAGAAARARPSFPPRRRARGRAGAARLRPQRGSAAGRRGASRNRSSNPGSSRPFASVTKADYCSGRWIVRGGRTPDSCRTPERFGRLARLR